MEEVSNSHVVLLVVQYGRRSLMEDLIPWVEKWCEGLYKDLIVRETMDGGCKILGKLNND